MASVQQGVGSVPASLINWAAGVIGIPPQVVAAQINEESGGNPSALSPTGAQGVAQFEPATWADQGCAGSPNDVNSAMTCYAKYMYQLLQQEGGNVRNALAAYNAGPGNLAAGYGYADTILANAGQPQGSTASGGTGDAASLDSASTAVPGSCVMNVSIPLAGSFCLLSKGQARGLIGGLLIVAGGLIALPGLVVLLVAVGGPGARAAAAVRQVPVAGKLAGAGVAALG